ncbi:CIC11C00000004092 [Sungouiella intermedia]|uniref:CIC11C00000004092 n=1 Tax=Sungouiella intermedia TaxID=45354 RepID=A0A1L0DE27_9ASCO|nr:CIC11C00000004092 [[Candida] intermedia]
MADVTDFQEIEDFSVLSSLLLNAIRIPKISVARRGLESLHPNFTGKADTSYEMRLKEVSPNWNI